MSSPRKQLQGILTSVDMNIPSTNIDNIICDNLDKMNISDDTNTITNIIILPTCANCGKEGNDVLNTCNKCNSVKYCNAACKKKHRQKHKKACERRVAELHDEKLFKQPPSGEDCSLCLLRMPYLNSGQAHNECCGKVICCGCMYANAKIDLKKRLCPFCRNQYSDSVEVMLERLKKRLEMNDAFACLNMGSYYSLGMNGLPQNHTKALELWHRAADLGCSNAYNNIGVAYYNGNGVERDVKKAVYYYELAAMAGDAYARHDLGNYEHNKGDMDRALKHYMIAARGGHFDSLAQIKELFMRGHVTKDDYTKALRARQAYLDEIKSFQRDEAVAFNDVCKYY